MKLRNVLQRIRYKVNPQVKDRLFCTIFGKEKYKKYALELYNAVNGSEYDDLSDLEIITLSDAVYLKMKNDVAYLISGTIALYEHQSTINLNMPVRGFMYMGELYSKILKRQNARLYNTALIRIPTPQYIVFYNGTDEYPEKVKRRLSDAFIKPREDKDYEFTATVYNINPGKNKELLETCKPLKGYSFFIDKIRANSRTMIAEEAVDSAVRECVDKGILKDVLSEERAAVMLEMLTTFDEKEYLEGLKEEARDAGLKEGREKGLKEGREEERVNTERERRRADAAEAELSDYKAELSDYKAELAKYKEKFGNLI